MSFSKRSVFILTGLISSLLLSACMPKTQDRPEGTENDAANYTVVSISGAIGGTKNVGEFPLPGEKTYNFKVCLVDYTRRSSIPNAKFNIKEIQKEVITDASGCLNWPEVIKFNYLADSVWLKMKRTLEPLGLQRGIREATFAINPWSHGEGLSEVVDLMKQTTPYLLEGDEAVQLHLQGKSKDGTPKRRKIWIESGERNVTNFIMKQGPVYNWHDQIYLRPQIMFGKMDSTPIPVAITHGSFNVEVSLILEDVQNQKVVRQVFATQTKEKVAMSNNTLMVDLDFSLKKVPTKGQTFMGIKLTPVGAPEGLLPFEGLFPLGNDHSFTQSTGLKVSEIVATENRTGNFSLKNFVGEKAFGQLVGIAGASSAPNAELANQQDAGIVIGFIKPDQFKIVKQNGYRRTLSFQASACLSNVTSNIGLSGQKFTIDSTGPDGQSLNPKPGQPVIAETLKLSNCMYWEVYTPEFDSNECQHYLPIKVRFQNKDLEIDQTLSVLIQPWEMSGFDTRNMPAGTTRYDIGSCKNNKDPLKVDNSLFMSSMTLARISYRPQVLDRTLQLTQKGVYHLRLNGVGIRDYSDPHSGAEVNNKNLVSGHYLARLVFTRSANARPDNGYVTHANVIVKGESGTLDGKMEFMVRDLQATMARKTVLVQLFPIDQKKLQSKEWKNDDPNIEDLIDHSTKLISPVFSAETAIIGTPGAPIALVRADDASHIPNLSAKIADGIKKEPKSSTLLNDIIKAGVAGQSAMIAKTAFNEKDAKTWHKWSQDQNLILIWMSDANSLQNIQKQFGLQGDVKAALQNFITMDKMDANWGKQFCRILADVPWKPLIESSTVGKVAGKSAVARSAFIKLCEAEVAKNPSAFVQKSAVYRVLDMKPAVIVPQKMSVSHMSVSSGFGFSSGHTEMEGLQSGVSITGQGGIGVSKSIFNAGVGLGASHGTVEIRTNDRNRHSGTDFGNSVGLNVNKWVFEVPMTRYQQCTMVRANPQIFVYNKEVSTLSALPRIFTDNQTFSLRQVVNTSYLYKPYINNNPMFRGWLICSDQVSTQPRNVTENYYLVSDGPGDSESFDSFDEINRLFFLPLRGTSDMARLKGLIGDSRNYPQDGEMSDELKMDLAAQVSPLLRRIDPAPGMILFDPAFDLPKLANDSLKPSNKAPLGGG